MVGRTLLKVQRGDIKCRLDCKLVDKDYIRPLLGRKACLGMKIVAYLDNDKLNKPSTGCAEVYTLSDSKNPLTEEHLFQKYSQVFSEVVGLMEGEYHI